MPVIMRITPRGYHSDNIFTSVMSILRSPPTFINVIFSYKRGGVMISMRHRYFRFPDEIKHPGRDKKVSY